MKELIKVILDDITKYENNNLENNIKNRLNKSLDVYLKSINNSYLHIVNNMGDKGAKKELMKWK